MQAIYSNRLYNVNKVTETEVDLYTLGGGHFGRARKTDPHLILNPTESDLDRVCDFTKDPPLDAEFDDETR